MKTKQRDHSLLYTCCSSELLHTADMKPLFISVLLAAMSLECRAQKDNVLQPEGDVTATEGEAVTLGCQYNSSTTSNYLFWYKQDGNNSPKFILSRFQGDEGNTADEFKERFSSTHNSKLRSVPLKIQKLQLADSAVYYCALRPATGSQAKMIFGRGTRLNIEPYEDLEPSYYKLPADNTTTPVACLATGFSKSNKAESKFPDIFNNKTPAVRISEDSLYNQVALISEENQVLQCVSAEIKDECVDTLKPDPKVNFVTLIVLGLRLLFLKTIAFNVLLTLRLWISQ